MDDSRFVVDHVRVTAARPFVEVAAALERQLGRFDPDVYGELASGGNTAAARARLEAMAGPSGFMLFTTRDPITGRSFGSSASRGKRCSTSSETRSSPSR
jgi:hypothetical protein